LLGEADSRKIKTAQWAGFPGEPEDSTFGELEADANSNPDAIYELLIRSATACLCTSIV
jgi:hypothetical protein